MSGTYRKNPDSEHNFPIEPGATIMETTNANGKRCQLIDNTGTIAPQELTELLAELIEHDQFGLNVLSSTDGVIQINKPKLTHIQIREQLYRLLVFRYQAVIEKF